jgi:hypothetical protein
MNNKVILIVDLPLEKINESAYEITISDAGSGREPTRMGGKGECVGISISDQTNLSPKPPVLASIVHDAPAAS